MLFALAIRHITVDALTIFVRAAKLMQRSCDIVAYDGKSVVESELHTRHATPGRLSMELENLLGGSGFQVEVGRKETDFFSTLY